MILLLESIQNHCLHYINVTQIFNFKSTLGNSVNCELNGQMPSECLVRNDTFACTVSAHISVKAKETSPTFSLRCET